MYKIIYKLQKKFTRSLEEEIDYNTLISMANNIKNIWLVDVRTKDEFNFGHIDRAINVPLQDLSGKIEGIIKNKNDFIIVYCQYGGRSKKALNKLKKKGYKNVYNLKDGIEGI